MLLIVQHIVVHWTERSRGGGGARQRNSVPEAFPLPAPGPAPAALLHTIAVHEHLGFEAPVGEISPLGAGPAYQIACAEVRIEAKGALLLFIPEIRLTGAPARPQFPREVGRIVCGQWARLVYNGRFAEETGWRYVKVVVNAGLFDPAVPGSFLDAGPIRELRDLAKLL